MNEKIPQDEAPTEVPAGSAGLDHTTESPTEGMDPEARAEFNQQRKMDMLSKKIEEKSAEGKKSKNLKWWIQTILLILLIIGSIVLLFGVTSLIEGEGMRPFKSMILGVNWGYFAILICIVLLYMFFESSKYSYLLKISTGKFYPRTSLKVMFLGKYYDGITPLGTGGQPFQIYYLHKKSSIPAGVATAVPLVKFIVTTIVYCSLAMVLFSIAPNYLPGSWGDTTLFVVAWVSMFGNLLIPVLMTMFSLFPNFGKKVIAWIVHFLWKIKIVRHKYRVMHKYVYEMQEYRRSLKGLIKKWWHFIPLALIALVVAVLSNSIPFFVILSITDVTPTLHLYVEVLCLSMVSFYASSFVPTPGNSGAFEGAGAVIFTTALAGYGGMTGLIGWSILVWRLLTYYIYIFTGVGINIFEIIRSVVRKSLAAKRGE